MERAARRLTPVLLELGGKDPMIVCRDADLDRAADGAAWGGCLMTGQVCMSVERVYVEAPVAEAFTAKLVERMRALRTGAERAGGRDRLRPVHQSAADRDRRAPSRRRRRQGRARAHRRHARRRRAGAVLRADGARRRRPLDGDHARGDLRPGHAGDGGGRRRGGGAPRQRQPVRAQRQRLDARRRARHRARRAARERQRLRQRVRALRRRAGAALRRRQAERRRHPPRRRRRPAPVLRPPGAAGRAAPPPPRAGVVPLLAEARARRSSG